MHRWTFFPPIHLYIPVEAYTEEPCMSRYVSRYVPYGTQASSIGDGGKVDTTRLMKADRVAVVQLTLSTQESC